MNQQSLVKHIAAIVTLDAKNVSGGSPIFVAGNRKEQEEIAFLLGRLLDGMVHDLGNGTLIVVKH